MSCTIACAFTALSTNIKVDPLVRIGQIAGIASIAFRYMLAGLTLVAALVFALRAKGGKHFTLATRLTCAAIAGLASAVLAAGIVVTLRGSPWCLNGDSGDAADLVTWANLIQIGRKPPAFYPPLGIYILEIYSRWFDIPKGWALKDIQIVGTALLGPLTYLSWRLVMRPVWALGVGLVAALPLIDWAPYKPYAIVVLIALIPVSIKFLSIMRVAHRYEFRRMAMLGVVFGFTYGVMCLFYSGWFKWSAGGVWLTALFVFPWRDRSAALKALVLGGIAVAIFGLLAGHHAIAAVSDSEADRYVYFDVRVEPGYIAMYKGDLPGNQPIWPPPGELGGVGLFTVILVIGLGAALALGAKRTMVILLTTTCVGCWLLRFWYAHLLYKTKHVNLYPRTTAELLYCSIALVGVAVYLLVERWREKAPTASVARSPWAVVGAASALLMLFGSAGTSMADHYMPNNQMPLSAGWLSWISHQTSLKYMGRLP